MTALGEWHARHRHSTSLASGDNGVDPWPHGGQWPLVALNGRRHSCKPNTCHDNEGGNLDHAAVMEIIAY